MVLLFLAARKQVRLLTAPSIQGRVSDALEGKLNKRGEIRRPVLKEVMDSFVAGQGASVSENEFQTELQGVLVFGLSLLM